MITYNSYKGCLIYGLNLVHLGKGVVDDCYDITTKPLAILV